MIVDWLKTFDFVFHLHSQLIFVHILTNVKKFRDENDEQLNDLFLGINSIVRGD
jgi:predicted transcriptional regulator